MSADLSLRPEWAALQQTRRLMFVLGVGLTYAMTILVAGLGWGQLTLGEHILVVLSFPLFVAGVAFSRRKHGMWLLILALLSILVCAMLYPQSAPRWIAAVLLASYCSYLWAVLSPRWIGALAIVLGPILLIVVWWQRPENVIPGGLAVANGSLAVIQVAIATAMIWWAWNSLRSEADRTDADLAVLDARTIESMLVIERAAMWRLTGTRLHESVLNSLRYLIVSPSIDREVLRGLSPVVLPTLNDVAYLESLPEPAAITRDDISEPFDGGRFLVTAALAGNALSGTSFLIYLLADQGAKAIPAAILGFVGSVIALVIVVRRVRLRTSWAIAIIAIPALLPWLLLSQDLGCQQALALSPILNASGFCVMVIAAWATRAVGAVGLMTWGVGGVLIAMRAQSDCRQAMTVTLVNVLVVLPVIVAVTYAGTAAYERSRRRAIEIRQQEIRERSRAMAALDINAELQDVVQEAVALIGAISEGAPVDEAMRERLRLVDGQIRADMQVDPQGAGAFAVLAKSIVDSLAGRGVIATVKGINSSADHRDIDASALDVVYRLLEAAGTRFAVQVISNGQEDFLSISLDARALTAAGLKPGSMNAFGDCMLDVDLNDVQEGKTQTATVVLSRSVEVT
jgi:hypothetical protein